MSSDLTIEAVLVDPMIRTVMRADRIEPTTLERLLRATAIEVARPRALGGLAPKTLVACQARAMVHGCCRA